MKTRADAILPLLVGACFYGAACFCLWKRGHIGLRVVAGIVGFFSSVVLTICILAVAYGPAMIPFGTTTSLVAFGLWVGLWLCAQRFKKSPRVKELPSTPVSDDRIKPA